MPVTIQLKTKWNFPKKWLEILEKNSERIFLRDKLRIVIDRKREDYFFWVNRKNEEVELLINIIDTESVDFIFKQDYLNAVIEHEAMHASKIDRIDYDYDKFHSPNLDIMTFSSLLDDLLQDIHANCLMQKESLKKFLEFEFWKFKRSWELFKNRRLTLNVMLICAYLNICFKKIEEKIPLEIEQLRSGFIRDPIDLTIYTIMENIFEKMWNEIVSGVKKINLKNETYELNEFVRIHPNPLI